VVATTRSSCEIGVRWMGHRTADVSREPSDDLRSCTGAVKVRDLVPLGPVRRLAASTAPANRATRAL